MPVNQQPTPAVNGVTARRPGCQIIMGRPGAPLSMRPDCGAAAELFGGVRVCATHRREIEARR